MLRCLRWCSLYYSAVGGREDIAIDVGDDSAMNAGDDHIGCGVVITSRPLRYFMPVIVYSIVLFIYTIVHSIMIIHIQGRKINAK